MGIIFLLKEHCLKELLSTEILPEQLCGSVFLNIPIFSYCISKVGHHFQSSSDDDDDFKPMSFLHTEHSLQQVGMLMTVTQLVLKTVCNQKFDI